MAHHFLAVFLIVFGFNIMFGLPIPIWVPGLLSVVAGVMLVLDHVRLRGNRK
jgi:hypothetical protein